MPTGGGQDMLILDGYNGNVITSGIIYAITTRTFGDKNHFLIEKHNEQHEGGRDRSIAGG